MLAANLNDIEEECLKLDETIMSTFAEGAITNGYQLDIICVLSTIYYLLNSKPLRVQIQTNNNNYEFVNQWILTGTLLEGCNSYRISLRKFINQTNWATFEDKSRVHY